MEILLNKIILNEADSRQFQAFEADLIINGAKVARVIADGTTHRHEFLPFGKKEEAALREAEGWCLKLPKVPYMGFHDGGRPILFDQDLDFYVSRLLDKYIEQNRLNDLCKEHSRKLLQNVIVRDPLADNDKMYKLRFPVKVLLATEKGQKELVDDLRKNLAPILTGERKVLNPHIPVALFLKAGIPEGKIATIQAKKTTQSKPVAQKPDDDLEQRNRKTKR